MLGTKACAKARPRAPTACGAAAVISAGMSGAEQPLSGFRTESRWPSRDTSHVPFVHIPDIAGRRCPLGAHASLLPARTLGDSGAAIAVFRASSEPRPPPSLHGNHSRPPTPPHCPPPPPPSLSPPPGLKLIHVGPLALGSRAGLRSRSIARPRPATRSPLCSAATRRSKNTTPGPSTGRSRSSSKTLHRRVADVKVEDLLAASPEAPPPSPPPTPPPPSPSPLPSPPSSSPLSVPPPPPLSLVPLPLPPLLPPSPLFSPPLPSRPLPPPLSPPKQVHPPVAHGGPVVVGRVVPGRGSSGTGTPCRGRRSRRCTRASGGGAAPLLRPYSVSVIALCTSSSDPCRRCRCAGRSSHTTSAPSGPACWRRTSTCRSCWRRSARCRSRRTYP